MSREAFQDGHRDGYCGFDVLLGCSTYSESPEEELAYRQGYLCGQKDAQLGTQTGWEEIPMFWDRRAEEE